MSKNRGEISATTRCGGVGDNAKLAEFCARTQSAVSGRMWRTFCQDIVSFSAADNARERVELWRREKNVISNVTRTSRQRRALDAIACHDCFVAAKVTSNVLIATSTGPLSLRNRKRGDADFSFTFPYAHKVHIKLIRSTFIYTERVKT